MSKLRMQTQREIDWTKSVGVRLRKERIAAGFSQSEFSHAINCTPSQLSRAESGKHALPVYCMRLVCQVLNLDANYLLCRKKVKKT